MFNKIMGLSVSMVLTLGVAQSSEIPVGRYLANSSNLDRQKEIRQKVLHNIEQQTFAQQEAIQNEESSVESEEKVTFKKKPIKKIKKLFKKSKEQLVEWKDEQKEKQAEKRAKKEEQEKLDEQGSVEVTDIDSSKTESSKSKEIDANNKSKIEAERKRKLNEKKEVPTVAVNPMKEIEAIERKRMAEEESKRRRAALDLEYNERVKLEKEKKEADAKAINEDRIQKRLALINFEKSPDKDEVGYIKTCSSTSNGIIDGLDLQTQTVLLDHGVECWGETAGVKTELTTGFRLRNSGPNTVNPLGKTQGSIREYAFKYLDDARQQIKMEIYENAKPEGADSAWSMLSSVYFVPRNILPYIEYKLGDDQIIVHLPTEETVTFKASSKEIIGGVLKEGIMDVSEDRHARKFAKLQYTGEGYMIRVDQRGDVPERDNVWNVKKSATITKGDQTCKVSASKLWHQNDETLYRFKFATDEAFYSFVLKECGF